MTEITLIRNVLNQKIGKSNHYWKIMTILQKNIVLFGRKFYLLIKDDESKFLCQF